MNETEEKQQQEYLIKAQLDLNTALNAIVHATDCMEKGGLHFGVVHEYMKTAFNAVNSMERYLTRCIAEL